MKKLLFSILLIPSISSAYTTIYNPFTGKLDYVGITTSSVSGSVILNQTTKQEGANLNVYGIVGTTATFGNSSDTTLGNNPWVTINSSGTSESLLIQSYGKPSGGYQNKLGALTIISTSTIGDTAAFAQPLLVLVDSTTDTQLGTGIFEIWSQNPNHNDPIFWMHTNSPNSGPDMRVDSKAFNFEFVNLSTDNAHGMGKWEIAMANQGIDFQFNNRAYNNSTFETMMYLHPLHTALAGGDGLIPGIYMNPQNVVDDGGILTSSGTSGITFFTLNAHTVGLTAPPNTTVSWTNALPDTVGASGNMLYHGGTVTNGQFTSRQWKWATDFNYSATTGVSASTSTVSAKFTLPSYTKAQLGARSPSAAGAEEVYCSDCTTALTCISTGTAAGAYSSQQAANRTTACN